MNHMFCFGSRVRPPLRINQFVVWEQNSHVVLSSTQVHSSFRLQSIVNTRIPANARRHKVQYLITMLAADTSALRTEFCGIAIVLKMVTVANNSGCSILIPLQGDGLPSVRSMLSQRNVMNSIASILNCNKEVLAVTSVYPQTGNPVWEFIVVCGRCRGTLRAAFRKLPVHSRKSSLLNQLAVRLLTSSNPFPAVVPLLQVLLIAEVVSP